MSVKIEKDVAMPGGLRFGARTYPFDQMEVGDSFLCNGFERHKLTSAAHSWGRVHQQKFSVRKTAEGYRCWRVA